MDAAPADAVDPPALTWGNLLRESAADRVPLVLRERVASPVRAVVVAVVVAALVSAGLIVRAWASTPAPMPHVALATPAATSRVPKPSATTVVGAPVPGQAGTVVVDVVGQVRRPGLVRLGAGARVADAVQAAGGVGPHGDLAAVNLARVVSDGEQIVVPKIGQPVPGAGIGSTGVAVGGGGPGGHGLPVVDLNSASVTELDGLPGVGPVIAGRIVEWRQAHGRFARVDELAEVGGIGPRLLAQLRPLVRV